MIIVSRVETLATGLVLYQMENEKMEKDDPSKIGDEQEAASLFCKVCLFQIVKE